LGHAPDALPKDVLQAMIQREALAQEAVRQDLHRSRPAVQAWRQTLAREYLAEVFETEVTETSMPMKDVEQVYKRNRVRFNHADLYITAHMVFACCRSGKAENCGDAETIECFVLKHEVIQDVYRQAKEALDEVAGDAASMEIAMQAFAESARGQFPSLAFEVFRFYWDRTLTRKEQAGRYDLADEAYAKVILDLPVATLSEPFKTEFGWHIATRIQLVPAVQRALTEPDVISEIREGSFSFFRRGAFMERINKLAGKFKVTMQADALSVLDSYWGTKP
jgi:hypothetical protein